MRVVIVGAGVMGSASAVELAHAGVEVVLIERAVPGAEASSAAAGMLGAQLESSPERPGELERFLLARSRYAAWSEALRHETGVDIGLRVSGALRVAFDEDDARRLQETVRWHHRCAARAEWLEGKALRDVEPALSDGALGAAYFPDEAQVEPPLLLRALNVAVARHPKITLRTGISVERLMIDGSSGRVTGVKFQGGELAADVVVLAAGSWSSMVAGVERASVVVQPSRGQLLQLEERPPRLRTILASRGAYVVPRGDGRVVCGATVELVGFRREVTAGGIHQVLSGALGLVPSLAEAEMTATWSSFRPYSESARPLVGKSEIPGLVLATGHHRNGILLAKITAEVVKEAVLG